MPEDRSQEFGDWLREGGRSSRSLSDETIATYCKVARLIARSRSALSILKPGLSMSTKAKYVAALRQYADFTGDVALELQLRPGPQLSRHLQRRKSALPQSIEAFSDDEVERFLEVTGRMRGKEPSWIWPCVSLQVLLGLRVGADLCGIRRTSVAEALRTDKLAVMGKRERVDHLPAGFVKEELTALSDIRNWDVVADAISPDSRKHRWIEHKRQAYQIYRRVATEIGRAAGVDASKTHRFRHWAITNFYLNVSGRDPLRTMRFARHRRLETTMKYIRLVDLSEDDRALAALRKR